MNKNCVTYEAYKDILPEIQQRRHDEPDNEFIVPAKLIFCKEQRRLNRELGLWGVNHQGNTNQNWYKRKQESNDV